MDRTSPTQIVNVHAETNSRSDGFNPVLFILNAVLPQKSPGIVVAPRRDNLLWRFPTRYNVKSCQKRFDNKAYFPSLSEN